MPLGMIIQQHHSLSQKLFLTQDMRFSLNLLQAPCNELQDLILDATRENPYLENDADERAWDAATSAAPVSRDWEEYLNRRGVQREQTRPPEDNDYLAMLQNNLTKKPSLSEHLLRQLCECRLGAGEMAVGQHIIGNLNHNGYLEASLEEIGRITGVEPELVERVLKTIQLFEPVGVAARSPQECLLVQLQSRGEGATLAARLVSDYLADLAAKRYGKIAQELGVTVDEIEGAQRRIKQLEPKPARNFDQDEIRVAIPDIIVERVDGAYVVALNDGGMPKLRVNKERCEGEIAQLGGAQKDVKKYLKEKLKAAQWVSDCVRQRQQTLLAVANAVFKRQREFLDFGRSSVKPLMMGEVAKEIGVHPSTVSRATSDKFVRTPQGLFPLRFFFQDSLSGAHREAVSSANVKAKIGAMIATEDRQKPLSDDQIANRLKAEYAISLARRTIAKYRDVMNLQPASLRRHLAQPQTAHLREPSSRREGRPAFL